MLRIFKVSTVVRKTIDLWKKETQYAYYLLLPAAVVSLLVTVLSASDGRHHGSFFFLLLVLECAILFLLMCATASLLFFLHDGKKEKWSDWQKYLRIFPKYVLLNIIFGLMVLVGLIFFVVPGIYLVLRYAWVTMSYLEHPEKNLETLFAEGAKFTEGYRWAILGVLWAILIPAIGLMTLFAMVLGSTSEMTFGVLSEMFSYGVIMPVVLIAPVIAYVLLKDSQHASSGESTEKVSEFGGQKEISSEEEAPALA
jgi:uncharacterized membrane protein